MNEVPRERPREAGVRDRDEGSDQRALHYRVGYGSGEDGGGRGDHYLVRWMVLSEAVPDQGQLLPFWVKARRRLRAALHAVQSAACFRHQRHAAAGSGWCCAAIPCLYSAGARGGSPGRVPRPEGPSGSGGVPVALHASPPLCTLGHPAGGAQSPVASRQDCGAGPPKDHFMPGPAVDWGPAPPRGTIRRRAHSP